jgi:hypothetical protein
VKSPANNVTVSRTVQPAVELELLEHEAYPVAPAPARVLGVDAEHPDVAAGPAAVALENLDRRRLAGAVRPQEAEDLTGLHLEVDASNGLVLSVTLRQAADGDRRFGHGPL